MKSLLDINIMDVPDLETVPGGEYKMCITRARVAPSKSKVEPVVGLTLTLKFADLDGKKSIIHWLALESRPDDTPDSVQINSLKLRDLLEATGCDQSALTSAYKQSKESSSAVDVPELVGVTAWAIVQEPIEDAFGLQNRISRFTVSL